MRKLVVGAMVTLLASSAWAGMIPVSNAVYQGAFRLPQGHFGGSTGSYGWAYGGQDLCFDPNSGGLFGTSITNNSGAYVGQVNVATPVISATKTLSQLNTATQTQNFYNLAASGGGADVVGMAVVGTTLYAETGGGYSGSNATLSQWSTTLSSPMAGGAWKINGGDGRNRNSQMTTAPTAWADANTGGRSILVMPQLQDSSHMGPTVVAVGPWLDGPPAAAGTVTTKTVLAYSSAHPMAGYVSTSATTINGLTFVTSGSDSAVVLSGMQTVGGAKHAYLWFYNPDDLAAVAAGTMPAYQPQPYATLDLSSYMFGTTQTASGITFDAANGKLYFSEMNGDGAQPLVHVLSITPEPATLVLLALGGLTLLRRRN